MMLRFGRVTLALWIASFAAPVAFAGGDAPVVALGSERMALVVKELAAAFGESHPRSSLRFDVRGGGSHAGVEALAAGRAAIALIARPPSTEEVRLVRDKTRASLVCVPIALDAVVFGVHPSNPLEALSLDQLRLVYIHKISDWKELGQSLSETQAPIRRYVPPASSGPRGVFQDRVMGRAAFTRNLLEKPNVFDAALGVSQDPLALGMVGFGQTSAMRAIAISGSEGSAPVFPTPQSIRSRAYPLSHYVYLGFAGAPDRAVKAFQAFVISPAGQRIIRESKAGFLPVLDEANGR